MTATRPAAFNQLRVRHFRLLETLVDAGSLHKAAAALHMSQPAASAMLQEVERALGVALFTRTRKGVNPNLHGKLALGRLRTVLSELAMLSDELHSAEALPMLRIGMLQHTFYGLLQRLLPEFLARTNCRLDITDGSTELIKRLEQNELDCLIGRMPAAWMDSFKSRGFFYQPLYEFEICVLANRAHPLARKRKVGLQDLSRFPWILSRHGSNSRYVLMAAFATAGLEPPAIRIETSSFLFSLPLLNTGDYLTVAPRDPSLQQQALGLARILPIELPKLLTPVAFVAQRSAMTNPNILVLWESVQKTITAPFKRTNAPAPN